MRRKTAKAEDKTNKIKRERKISTLLKKRVCVYSYSLEETKNTNSAHNRTTNTLNLKFEISQQSVIKESSTKRLGTAKFENTPNVDTVTEIFRFGQWILLLLLLLM